MTTTETPQTDHANVRALGATSELDRHRAPQWTPGRSRNPGGRPKKLAELEALAREHTVGAFKCYVAALADDNVQIRLYAADRILDRGWGKARQVITGDPDNPLRVVHEQLGGLSSEQLSALHARVLALIGALPPAEEHAEAIEGQVSEWSSSPQSS